MKRRINELKDALSPTPLFAKPPTIISPDQILSGTLRTLTTVRKNAKLLRKVRLYVTKNINKRLIIISQA